jgi:hypothetical protein
MRAANGALIVAVGLFLLWAVVSGNLTRFANAFNSGWKGVIKTGANDTTKPTAGPAFGPAQQAPTPAANSAYTPGIQLRPALDLVSLTMDFGQTM